jgi:hypothetical protein
MKSHTEDFVCMAHWQGGARSVGYKVGVCSCENMRLTYPVGQLSHVMKCKSPSMSKLAKAGAILS